MNKVFLDANIVLDFLDSSRKGHFEAERVFNKIIDDDWIATISEDLLTTIYYIVKNKKRVLNFFEVILEQWHIVSFGTDIIRESVELCSENISLDFEDVNQSLCARKNNCHLIISNDKSFYQCGIPVIESSEF